MSFGRFSEAWGLDFVQFSTFGSTGCSCCGVEEAAPSNIKLQDYVKQCDDIDPKRAFKEMELSPFQAFMVEDIWRDRLIIRKMLRTRIKKLFTAWKEEEMEVVAFYKRATAEDQWKMLTCSSREIRETLITKFSGAYVGYMEAALKQVANFPLTQMPPDGVSAVEKLFDKHLVCKKVEDFDNKETFLLEFEDEASAPASRRKILFDRIEEVVGDMPLCTEPCDEVTVASHTGKCIPSFRGERRLVRIFIFLAMCERIFTEYKLNVLRAHSPQQNPNRRTVLDSAITMRGDSGPALMYSAQWEEAQRVMAAVPRGSRLPVTLLTGFLGAGKTTVLNYILGRDHGLRICVVVNELGEIDIDSLLVENKDEATETKGSGSDSVSACDLLQCLAASENQLTKLCFPKLASADASKSGDQKMIELPNGCMCCTIQGEFVDSMLSMLKNREKYDYMIIETTGVADPKPIMESLETSGLSELMFLDQVMVLVDSSNFRNDAYKSKSAKSQIQMADTILLSKIDLVTEKTVNAVAADLVKIRPSARILRSCKGQLPIELILDVGMSFSAKELREEREKDEKTLFEAQGPFGNAMELFGADGGFAAASTSSSASASPKKGHKNSRELYLKSRSGSTHLLDDAFESVSFRTRNTVDRDKFERAFRDLKTSCLGPNVFRAKGILQFSNTQAIRHVFHLSGRRTSFEKTHWKKGEMPESVFVVIGRNLSKDKLRAQWGACIAHVGGEVWSSGVGAGSEAGLGKALEGDELDGLD